MRSRPFLPLFGVFLLFSAPVLVLPNIAHADITSGLVGYWNFDEGSGTTAADTSGSGNNGTLTNGPTWVAGKIGSGALSFDGINDRVNINDSIDVGTVTMCSWIYPKTLNNGRAVFGNARFYLGSYLQNNQFALYSNTSGGGPLLSTTNSVNTNTWQHICAVRNSGTDGPASIYINGTLNSSGNSTTPVPGAGLAIGDDMFNEEPWDGSLDDVRIYNRALTAGDIAELYAYTGGSTPPPASDTTAPSIPSNLSATAVSSSGINLTWTASTDAVGVTGYKVYRGGTQIATPTTNSYSDTGLSASTAYSYTVAAYDAAGNTSAQSSNAGATTQAGSQPDTTAPTISSISSGSVTSSSATITWTTNESADTQVEYGLTTSYGNNTSLNSSLTTSHSQSISSLAASTLYHYRVKSKDAAGNLATSPDNTFTTQASQSSDTTAPSIPSNLSATAVSSSGINLTWTASTDAVGVTGYKVYRGGTQIATPTTNSYSDTGLSASTAYSYTVAAYDAAGNTSAQSSSAGATTQAGSQGSGVIIPADRKIDWSQSGIPGGIPNRTSICSTIAAGASQSAIQSALNSCPQNQVVKLSAGTYSITGNLVLPSNVVLRGAGPKLTILNSTGSGLAPIVFGSDVTPSISTSVAINSGATSGSTNISVASASGISVGSYLMITELNDPSFVTITTNNGTCGWCDGGTGWNGSRVRGQIVEVTSVSGTNISISPGLYSNYSRTPLATPFNAGAKNTGVEDLQVYMNNTGYTSNFYMSGSAYSWIKNVESNYTDGDHVRVFYGYRNEIRDNYFHDAYTHSPGSTDADVFIASKSSGTLLENNTMRRLHASVMLNWGAAGNVIAYNYTDNNFDSSGYNTTFAAFYTHGAHPQFNLWEGNYSAKLDADYFWGSSSHNTAFRNWFRGAELIIPPLTGRAPEDTANSYWAFQAMSGIDISQVAKYYNLIGNVVGSDRQKSLGVWTPLAVAPTERSFYTSNNPFGYTFGYASVGDSGTDSGDNSAPYTTAIIHGGYDYVRNAFTWDSGISNHNIPASMYLYSKPAWFGSLAWPAFGPDPNTPTIALTGSIPAKYCFDQGLMPGCLNSGSAPTTFILSVTKGGTGSGTVTSSVGGISCGSTCTSSSLNSGTSVTLTASASGGSIFAGWSGGGCSGTGTCTTTISSNTAITATFNTSGTPSDTTAPTIPTSLASSNITSGGVTISWSASTDAVGVTGYKIYRGGTQIGTSVSTAYTDSGLTASTLYSYTVSAYDAAGNTSNQSSPLSVTTSAVPVADTTLPTVSITAPTNGSTVSGSSVSIAATASDNIGVVGVQFKLDGTNLGSELTVSPYSGTWNTTSVSNGSHTLTATARDAAGNTRTSTVTVTVNNVAPTFTLTATKSGAGTGTVTSSVGGINCGATCSVNVTSGTSVTMTATPNSGSTFLGWGGACTGTGGCTTTVSSNTTVSAAFGTAPDTTPPSTPTAITSSSLTQTGVTLSWLASIDNVGVSGYKLYRGTTLIASPTTNSYAVTGLTASTLYTFTVSAYDAAGNESSLSLPTSITTASVPVTTHTVTATKTGNGTITGNGLNCGSTCSVSVTSGTVITLTATPSADSTFTGWGGACTGTGSCTTTVSAAKSVSATFTLIPVSTPPVTPPASGGGGGGGAPVTAPTVGTLTPTVPQPTPTKPVVSCTTSTVVTAQTPFTRSLTVGSTGSDVKALQQFLNIRGFYVSLTGVGSKGNESTYFGPATAKAVAKFQLANGILPSSGLFGPITMKKVNSMLGTSTTVPCTTTPTVTTSSTYTRSLTIGSTGNDVKALQIFLNTHGFPVSTSGVGSRGLESIYFGPATTAALARFQASKGIVPAAGYFGPVTMKTVMSIK